MPRVNFGNRIHTIRCRQFKHYIQIGILRMRFSDSSMRVSILRHISEEEDKNLFVHCKWDHPHDSVRFVEAKFSAIGSLEILALHLLQATLQTGQSALWRQDVCSVHKIFLNICSEIVTLRYSVKTRPTLRNANDRRLKCQKLHSIH